jgi:hypothetical protein
MLDPSAGRDGDARDPRKKNQVSRQKSCETKGLEQDAIHFKSDPALSVLARAADELAANYQDAVKGVLTLSRPCAMGAQEVRLWFSGGGTLYMSFIAFTASRQLFVMNLQRL